MLKHLQLQNALLFFLFLFSVQIMDAMNPIYDTSADIVVDYAGPEEDQSDAKEDRLEQLNSTSLLNRILIPLYFFCALLLFAKSQSAQRNLLNSPGIVLYLAIVIGVLILSVLVSESTDITIRRSIFQLLLTIGLILNLYVIKDTQKMYGVLAAAFSIVVLVDVYYYWFIPEAFSSNLRFKGYHTDKNTAGHTLAIAFVCFYHQITRPNVNRIFRLIYFLLLYLCGFLVFFSGSKTSMAIIAIFFALSLTVFKSASLKKLTIVALYIGCMTISLVWIFTDTDPELLTNRGEIWNFLHQFVWAKLYFGYGYASFWSVGDFSQNIVHGDTFLQTINTAHNGYIDLILSFGLFGFGLIMLAGLFPIINFAKLNNTYLFSHYMLVVFLIGNLTESFLFYYSNIIWVVFFAVMVTAYQDTRQTNRRVRRRRRTSTPRSE